MARKDDNRACVDCGEPHASAWDAMVCTYRKGGHETLVKEIAGTGVRLIRADMIAHEVGQASSMATEADHDD